MGEAVKRKTGARVVGVELDKVMAGIAARRIDQVIVADLEQMPLALDGQPQYDCLIFADILEHLRDPWSVLRNLTQLLLPKGIVIASIPNIQHYSTFVDLLLHNRWPYRTRGIHDRTHLRFFAWQNIQELFAQAELVIEQVERNYRLVEQPRRVNQVAHWVALPGVRPWLTYQYLIVAKKR